MSRTLNRDFSNEQSELTQMQRKRGRPSIHDLMTPKPLQRYARQPLPAELSGEESETYLALVNSHEASWFPAGSVPLLVQLCRHVTQARRVAELIEGAVGKPETTIDYYEKLLRMQRIETGAITSLCTKLRLSPQALRNDRGNLRASPTVTPPWEWKPEGSGP
jgi:hypothetical protein